MTPRTYWNACRLHNWNYEDEDDEALMRDGIAAHHELLRLAQTDARLKAIRHAWVEHKYYSGPMPPEPKMGDEQ
jgi:hypothetical protein